MGNVKLMAGNVPAALESRTLRKRLQRWFLRKLPQRAAPKG